MSFLSLSLNVLNGLGWAVLSEWDAIIVSPVYVFCMGQFLCRDEGRASEWDAVVVACVEVLCVVFSPGVCWV